MVFFSFFFFFFFYKFYNCNFQTTEPDFIFSGIGTIFFYFGFIPGREIFFEQIPPQLPYLMVATLYGPVPLVLRWWHASQYGTRINSQCRGAAVRKGQLNLMVHYDCYAIMGSGYNGDAKRWLQRSDRITHPAGAACFGDSRKYVSRFTFQKLKMRSSHNFAHKYKDFSHFLEGR